MLVSLMLSGGLDAQGSQQFSRCMERQYWRGRFHGETVVHGFAKQLFVDGPKTRHPLLEAALHGADKRRGKPARHQLGNLFFKRRAVCLVTMSTGLVANALNSFAHAQWA